MKVETKDGITTITAEAGAAIHREGTPTPSHTVGYRFDVGKDDAANWEDCELGEPEQADEPTEADKDAALRRFGVEV